MNIFVFSDAYVLIYQNIGITEDIPEHRHRSYHWFRPEQILVYLDEDIITVFALRALRSRPELGRLSAGSCVPAARIDYVWTR